MVFNSVHYSFYPVRRGNQTKKRRVLALFVCSIAEYFSSRSCGRVQDDLQQNILKWDQFDFESKWRPLGTERATSLPYNERSPGPVILRIEKSLFNSLLTCPEEFILSISFQKPFFHYFFIFNWFNFNFLEIIASFNDLSLLVEQMNFFNCKNLC